MFHIRSTRVWSLKPKWTFNGEVIGKKFAWGWTANKNLHMVCWLLSLYIRVTLMTDEWKGHNNRLLRIVERWIGKKHHKISFRLTNRFFRQSDRKKYFIFKPLCLTLASHQSKQNKPTYMKNITKFPTYNFFAEAGDKYGCVWVNPFRGGSVLRAQCFWALAFSRLNEDIFILSGWKLWAKNK